MREKSWCKPEAKFNVKDALLVLGCPIAAHRETLDLEFLSLQNEGEYLGIK